MSRIKADFGTLNSGASTTIDDAYANFVVANCADPTDTRLLIKIAAANFTKQAFKASKEYAEIKDAINLAKLEKVASKLSKDDLKKLATIVE